MTRGTNAALLSELRSVDPKWITLIAIETGDVGPPWLRYTDDEADVVFPDAGDTYEARPIEVSDVSIDGEDREGITVRLADVDFEIDTWLLTTDFRYKKVWRYLVERDSLDSSAKAIKDLFRIVNRDRGDRFVQFTAEPLAAIFARIELPQRVMTREDFPGIPSEGAVR